MGEIQALDYRLENGNRRLMMVEWYLLLLFFSFLKPVLHKLGLLQVRP